MEINHIFILPFCALASVKTADLVMGRFFEGGPVQILENNKLYSIQPRIM